MGTKLFQTIREIRFPGSAQGFMAAEWSVGIALLLFPAFILVMTVLQIPARQSLSQDVSSAAARAYVQALDQSQAEEQARAAAEQVVLSEYPSADVSSISIQVVSSTLYCAGNEITLRVGIKSPIVINPFANYEDVTNGITVHSESTERIDDYAELADSETGNPAFDYDDENGRCDP